MNDKHRRLLREPIDNCTKCGPQFKGFHVVGPNLFEKCECTLRSEQIGRYIDAGIPSKFFDMTWEDYVYTIPKNIYTYLKDIDHWLKKGVGLYFHGPNGSGKTFLMAQIAKFMVDRGYKVKFFKLDKVINATYRSISLHDEEAEEFLEQLDSADLFCIDEMDKVLKKNNTSEITTQDILYDTLFRNVSNENKAICCTTNITMDDLEKVHGTHIRSLIDDILVPTEINNPDFRKIGGSKLKDDFEKAKKMDEITEQQALEEDTK